MKLLHLFLALFLVSGLALGASAPLNKDATTTIKTDIGGTSNRLGWVSIQTIPAAESTDTDQIMAAFVNAFNSTTKFVLLPTSSQFLAQPDVPRNIIATMNTSTSGSLKLTGADIAGAVITENLTWTAETGAKSSTKAFKTVTRVDGTCTTNTAQFILGTGDLLGLNSKLVANTVLFCALDNTREATAPSVTYNSTILSLNTIDTSTAPGGKVCKVWMIV